MSKTLVPYCSSFGLNSIHNDFDNLVDRMFDSFWVDPSFAFRNWKPTEITSTDKEYKIEIELPRFEKKDVQVQSVDGSVVITAKNGKTSYVRSFNYPDFDADNAKVELKNGVLTVLVPRIEPKTKTLEIS